MTYDVVIVGAGPSGLAAAARLSHFGVSVCLLEAHRRLGGLSSWHHVKGREISSGLHAFTNYSSTGRGGPLGKLLRQLRLKYDDLGLRPQVGSSIRFPSAALRFTNDPEFFRQQIAAVFPRQIDHFDRFRQLVLATDEGELTRVQRSARMVMEEYFTEPLLVEMLLCPIMFYGNPGGVGDGHDVERTRPDMDWLLFCVVWKCIFESGFGYPVGGMRPLWETLARRVGEGGGVIRTEARVERFITHGGRVTAARLSSGEDVAGRTFLSSAGAVETDLLLAPEKLPASPVGLISIVEGIGILDIPPADANLTDTVIFYSFSDEFHYRRPVGLAERDNGVVCAPGNYQPFDPDENIVKVTQLANYRAWRGLTPEQYALGKSRTADGMAEALNRLGVSPFGGKTKPGRWGSFDDLFTPLTIERYTGHAEGALYGSMVKTRTGATACGNLFLIGADQGFHGIVGAMLSGVAMANLHVLAKQS